MSRVLDLTKALISKPSVTPEDCGCQALIAERLGNIGFDLANMPSGPVKNLWARRGSDAPLLCLAGHTDVVPPGPLAEWTSAPFEPVIRDGWLYGRGSADMKAALAAMVVACEELIDSGVTLKGSLAFLITSDEEGEAIDGTAAVVEQLVARGEKIDYCLVGEPSCSQLLGDTVRIGRRGSLNGELHTEGIQGHVAYPHIARNPLHELAPALAELTATRWDDGNIHFPATTFQATALNCGAGATNVIPGHLDLSFNFRYSTEQSAAGLMRRVEEILDGHGLEYEISWHDSGQPFLTPEGFFSTTVQRAIGEVCGMEPDQSTAGGTSDGRFISPTGAHVLEFGHLNKSIHQVDERVRVDDLEKLKDVYRRILQMTLAGG
ncbi:MAG: succinyl-diaminopimelate desuccinylase [Gammaproteobacteria bacterium]